MFNPLNLIKRKKEKPDPPGIHPKHKIIKPSVAPNIPDQKEIANKEAADKLRKLEFEKLKIPYSLVLKAESKGIVGINPNNIALETKKVNTDLKLLGFDIVLSYLECFECQILYLDYQRYKEVVYKTKKVILPDRALIEVVVIYMAEKTIRNKYQITENPTIGERATKFQSEVKMLYESACKKSLEHQLKLEAVARIYKEKHLNKDTILPETEIRAMMEKIRIEKRR